MGRHIDLLPSGIGRGTLACIDSRAAGQPRSTGPSSATPAVHLIDKEGKDGNQENRKRTPQSRPQEAPYAGQDSSSEEVVTAHLKFGRASIVGKANGMPLSRTIWSTILSCLPLLALCASISAQEAVTAANPQQDQQLRQWLSGATLVGHFTDDAAEADGDPLSAERYEISKIERMGTSDLWLIHARIQYGDKDLQVPVPVFIKWAGQTPVITMDRVASHNDRISGSTHD